MEANDDDGEDNGSARRSESGERSDEPASSRTRVGDCARVSKRILCTEEGDLVTLSCKGATVMLEGREESCGCGCDCGCCCSCCDCCCCCCCCCCTTRSTKAPAAIGQLGKAGAESTDSAPTGG